MKIKRQTDGTRNLPKNSEVIPSQYEKYQKVIIKAAQETEKPNSLDSSIVF